ncbi:TetR family transcriptional regulator [Teichococcus vastitatis]|jgi:AcrR family transcriptional regulator|uniref:TetR family transcriptional regulator n=1 Tax=Teichococcus vastitatis TaxID=2307076 RepID=A0ABS9W140_9PROT|nr:TetR family transcriptional regulator [Pseudoroseomonas vastitatis]MCI0752927.1 TetR family transcriptional regulator [Pseudoroseomonas vastitatis]
MARRTKQEADETREALLDAAEQVFLERGVARASLDEVARAAGCTRGAVHWHFGDKLGLFLALDERLVLVQDEMMRRLCLCQQMPPLEGMAKAITAAMADLENNPSQRRLLTIMLHRCEYVAEMEPALARRREADRKVRDGLRDVFRMAAERGELAAPWTPDKAALFLHMMLAGFILEWLRGDAGFSLTEEASEAVRGYLACTASAVDS